MTKLGIYIHIPFCESKCPYCDFYSIVPTSSRELDEYIISLKQYIKTSPYSGEVDSIYFGGGTPSLMGADRLGQIVKEIKSSFNVSSEAEITLEANPSSIDDFEGYLKAGFNRISYGVQSTNDSTLKLLGRRHSAKEAFSAVNNAREAGFSNISVDLMAGVPNTSLEDLSKDIDKLTSLPISHISVYLLKLEEGTVFKKRYNDLDDDFLSDSYILLCDKLKALEFEHYEISNFCKEGKKSRHNLKYWQLENYLGIGPSAHSFIDGKRFYFDSDLNKFLNSCWNDIILDGEGGDEEEKIMLSLRLSEGIDISLLGEKAKRKLPLFEREGLVEMVDNRISLTTKGYLMSNSIISELI